MLIKFIYVQKMTSLDIFVRKEKKVISSEKLLQIHFYYDFQIYNTIWFYFI